MITSAIKNFPQQFSTGISAAKNVRCDKFLNHILVAGMGGSLIPGKLLQLTYPQVQLWENYSLPQEINDVSTVICISWSGNTRETLSMYKEARNRGLEIICITTGGKLAETARADDKALIILPAEAIQSRFAVGYMTGALFKVLGKEADLPTVDAKVYEKYSQELAQKIQNQIPLLYSFAEWGNLAESWKILFNENTKIHSFHNTLPRLVHNEISGFTTKNSKLFFVLLLVDSSNTEDLKNKDLQGLLAILDKLDYNYHIVELSGKTLLEKVINSYILGLWTSSHLAYNLGIDPEDISVIEEFKKFKQ